MKKQLVELTKTIVIVLLLCSLLLLVAASLPTENIRSTPWLSTALQPFGRILNLPQAELSYVETELPVMDAALPLAVSVRNHAGRATILWDFEELDSAFEALGGLLGEAMDTAADLKPVSDQQLQNALSDTSVYFAYGASLPVSLLAAWLDVSLPGTDMAVTACALAVEQDIVHLYLVGTETYAASTRVSAETVLNLLEPYRPDGSELGFESKLSLHDLTLIPSPQQVISSATGENPRTTRFLEQLATNLGFNPYGDSSYTNTKGDTYYSETNCDLMVSADGLLTLQAENIERFQASGTQDEELIEEARRLLDLAVGDSLGDARLYLTGISRTDAQTTCYFDYYLSGIPVKTTAEHAAVAVFTDKYLTRLQLQLTTYRITGTPVNLLPAAHAAAILPADSHLTPMYLDNGSGELTAGWRKQSD